MLHILCERGLYAWLDRAIALGKDGKLGEIDRDVLLDEFESIGKRDKRELANRLVILTAHLLKWQHQAGARSSGWIGSSAEQRLQIAGQLEDCPSLKTLLPSTVRAAYPKSR